MPYNDAFEFVTQFYADSTRRANTKASEGVRSGTYGISHATCHIQCLQAKATTGELTAAVTTFPRRVTVALAHLIKYLRGFDVADALLKTQFFARFAERTHMLLNGNTLTNLWVVSAYSPACCSDGHVSSEIYRNETDFTQRGSLLWVLDHTTTKFGARMLREWVGRPLTDRPCVSVKYFYLCIDDLSVP